MKSFHLSIAGLWLVAGDYNSVVHHDEIMGSSSTNRHCLASVDCIEACSLHDMDFQALYTWKRNNLKERLDRVMVNRSWLEYFLE